MNQEEQDREIQRRDWERDIFEDESRDEALQAAVQLMGRYAGHRMLGCDWGDREPCTRQARQRMVLHDGTTEYLVKLCREHAALVEQHTNPHREVSQP